MRTYSRRSSTLVLVLYLFCFPMGVPAAEPYEADLKFDVLEAQIQQLRKKMMLQSKRKAEQTEEWNRHYQEITKQLKAWDNFIDEYKVQ